MLSDTLQKYFNKMNRTLAVGIILLFFSERIQWLRMTPLLETCAP